MYNRFRVNKEKKEKDIEPKKVKIQADAQELENKKDNNNNYRKKYGRRNVKENKSNNNNEEKSESKNEESDTGSSAVYIKDLLRKSGFTKGRLINDSNNDIIKIDNDEVDLKNKENSKNKTDDNLPEKEIPSQKEFIIGNNKNAKKRRTLATTVVPEPKVNKSKFHNKNQKNINEIKEEDVIKEINPNNEYPKNKLKNKEIKSNDNNDEFIKLDNTINELEQFNAKKILKGDLYEIYEDLIKENIDFKDDIFFVNLNNFEKKVGNCDDRLILHSYKEYPKNEYFKEYLSADDLLNKYIDKASVISNEK
jgi:hypothetical protein